MHAIFKDFLHLCEFPIKLTINRTSTKREITVIGSLTPKYCPFFHLKSHTYQPTNPLTAGHCWQSFKSYWIPQNPGKCYPPGKSLSSR